MLCTAQPTPNADWPAHPPDGALAQVLDEVGDEDATYSPLGRGASVLSDRGYLDGDMPRSTASWGPAVPDSAGAPRSPW